MKLLTFSAFAASLAFLQACGGSANHLELAKPQSIENGNYRASFVRYFEQSKFQGFTLKVCNLKAAHPAKACQYPLRASAAPNAPVALFVAMPVAATLSANVKSCNPLASVIRSYENAGMAAGRVVGAIAGVISSCVDAVSPVARAKLGAATGLMLGLQAGHAIGLIRVEIAYALGLEDRKRVEGATAAFGNELLRQNAALLLSPAKTPVRVSLNDAELQAMLLALARASNTKLGAWK